MAMLLLALQVLSKKSPTAKLWNNAFNKIKLKTSLAKGIYKGFSDNRT